MLSSNTPTDCRKVLQDRHISSWRPFLEPMFPVLSHENTVLQSPHINLIKCLLLHTFWFPSGAATEPPKSSLLLVFGCIFFFFPRQPGRFVWQSGQSTSKHQNRKIQKMRKREGKKKEGGRRGFSQLLLGSVSSDRGFGCTPSSLGKLSKSRVTLRNEGGGGWCVYKRGCQIRPKYRGKKCFLCKVGTLSK